MYDGDVHGTGSTVHKLPQLSGQNSVRYMYSAPKNYHQFCYMQETKTLTF